MKTKLFAITLTRAEWRELVRRANAADVQAHRDDLAARLLAFKAAKSAREVNHG